VYWGSNSLTPDSGSTQIAEIFKEPSFVETVNNRIYFYADVYKSEVLQLNKHLRELNNELAYDAKLQSREPASIFLHINSYGGSVFDGLAAMDAVLSCDVPVITIIDGACASAATFMAIVGNKRWIPKHSFMLIHQLSAGMWGKFRELQDDNENNIKLMETIKTIYSTYTKIPHEKLDSILDHDLWLDAKQCLQYGLADRII